MSYSDVCQKDSLIVANTIQSVEDASFD